MLLSMAKMARIFHSNLSPSEWWPFPFSSVSDSEIFVVLQTLEAFIFSKLCGPYSKDQKPRCLTSIVWIDARLFLSRYCQRRG